MDHRLRLGAYTLKGIFILLLQTIPKCCLTDGSAMPRNSRAPRVNARAETLAIAASNFVIALRLMGCALAALDNDHGRAILATSWEISKRLDRRRRILKQ